MEPIEIQNYMNGVPKKIWFFWYQGFVESPALVKMCFNSWKIKNPDYQIEFLDKDSVQNFIKIPEHISLSRNDITFQKYANFIRLQLLLEYGGVWIDADIYCFKSLQTWLNDSQLKSGVFMYSNTFPDRLIANWFIAATQNNYLIQRWLETYSLYFKNNKLKFTYTKAGKYLRRKIRQRNDSNIKDTGIWFSFFIRKILKISPYLIMHYIFNKLYITDSAFRSIWDSSMKTEACLRDLRCQMLFDLSFTEFEKQYHRGEIKLIKMSHKINSETAHERAMMDLIYKDYELLKRDE